MKCETIAAIVSAIIVGLLLFISVSETRSDESRLIYCPEGKTAVYLYTGPVIEASTEVKAEYFRPVDENVENPKETDPMNCPGTDVPLNGYEWWFWKRGRPLPKLTFPGAVTLLTKDEQGNFLWWPWELDIED
jgi:hypothetical protein